MDPDAVAGTGPRGRVTEDDLRAASVPSASVPSAPVVGGVAALRVSLPAEVAADRERLLAGAALAVLTALRRDGGAATSIGLSRDGRTSVVANAHDLTVDGLRRRLADGPPDSTCDLRVLDAVDVDAQVGRLRPGERVVLAVGAVRENVAVERGPEGETAFAVRTTVTLTVATTAELPESLSVALVRAATRGLTA